ncbi:hypothetical protein ZWY2020_055071 [Hordeum vulgare]|nr:hypothetical protein ZWY2020_055071 [Hordeum vulgare]
MGMTMPLKRHGPRRSPLQAGVSRRRLGEDGASLSGSLADSDRSSPLQDEALRRRPDSPTSLQQSQVLVILGTAELLSFSCCFIWMQGGHEYTSWSRYREFYNTPEADRDYLRYWETIVKELKWLEQYLLTNESSIEWGRIHSKATFQACRIASGFDNMTVELAAVGLHVGFLSLAQSDIRP